MEFLKRIGIVVYSGLGLLILFVPAYIEVLVIVLINPDIKTRIADAALGCLYLFVCSTQSLKEAGKGYFRF